MKMNMFLLFMIQTLKKKFSELNPFKPKKSKKKEPKVITSCDDYSTKNFADLFRKIRCKFD